jgi:hypothetical protein
MFDRRVAVRAAGALVIAAVLGCGVPDEVTAPSAVPTPMRAIAPPPAGVASGVFIDGTPLGKPGLSA